MELDGRTALITGAGAVGGIGQATAQLFLQQGAKVIVTGRDAAAGAAAVDALAVDGGKVRFVAADLTDLDQVHHLAEEAGDVDILVNNAATFTIGPSVALEPSAYEAVFATNVRAPFFLTAALVGPMLSRGNGSIVNVSTMVARIGMPGMAAYGASKAALEALTRTWAAEFASAGVRVNAVAAGPTRSAKVVSVMGDGADQMSHGVPLARLASTTEIAQTILFLASDRASYLTGTVLAADGGRTAV